MNTFGPERSRFRPLPAQPQSERVQRYVVEHGGDPWQNHLSWVLETFPQTVNGEIRYLIYAGSAIKLLYPQRPDPGDIDIVTRDESMAHEFPPQRGSQPIDVKPIEVWLQRRRFTVNPRLIEFIFGEHQKVAFNEREVLIMTPPLLVVDKLLGSPNKRDKDSRDIALLGVDEGQVLALIQFLRELQ